MRVNYITPDDPAIPRFWAKVRKTDTCWLWTASLNAYGYGNFRYRRSTYLASRFAYLITVGPIPQGMKVCHHCDNPTCVRPDHLFLGTQRDNLKDMVKKGRQGAARGDQSGSRKHPECRPRGEQSHNAKLTTEQVQRIRELYIPGMTTQKELAEAFGVGTTTIYTIVRRKKWRHVP